jgi:zinc protease
MQGIDDSQQEWAEERGAIEQEVARDLSNPTYKFIDRLNRTCSRALPMHTIRWAPKIPSTRPRARCSRISTTSGTRPGNCIHGDCGRCGSCRDDEKVQQWFGGVASHPLPARPEVDLTPVKSEAFTLDSNLPYTLGFIAYRFPGTDSPDYAASQILADVLASQRADLYGMVPAGKALAAEFGMTETYPKASVGYGLVVLPSDTDPTAPSVRCAAFLRPMPGRAYPTIWSPRPFAVRLPRLSFSGTPSRAWQTCGPMRWLPKDANLPMRILKPSSASRLPM